MMDKLRMPRRMMRAIAQRLRPETLFDQDCRLTAPA
jgi:hypothetical protein